MKFSYNWLKELSKTKLSPEKLAEFLTMHFAEVEEVKKEGKDFVLDIDVRPNRAGDCFSHLGVAREIAAIAKLKFETPIYKIQEDKNLKAKDFVSVEVKPRQACPRYTARVITDVKVGPSPKWMRDRLKVCGLRSINNIVDITNYVMLETGQPLHAFDIDKLEGQKIIVRFAKEGEKIVTLDEEKYDLYEDILVIADAKKPIAIAGIKGGKALEINSKTKIIVLESANFNQGIIRQGSKMTDLKTDASIRFEHGLDPNLTEFAINRAAYLIQKIAKGKITQGLVDVYPKKVGPKIIRLDLDYVERLLGVKIPMTEIKNILERLGFKIKKEGARRRQDSNPPAALLRGTSGGGSGAAKLKMGPAKAGGWWEGRSLNVVVPTFRLDISLPEDLIEEIGRLYGYQKIPAIFPVAALIPPQRNLNIFWEDITKNILKEVGFTEVYNYSFISEDDTDIFKYNKKDLIELENSISSDFQYLRPSLIPNLLKNIAKNQKNFSEIKIFELGKIFQPPKSEQRLLTGVITGDKFNRSSEITSQFYEVKGVIDLLLNKLGISNVWFAEPSAHLTLRPAKRDSSYDEYRTKLEEAKISWWHPKKCAELKVGQERIGFLGEISPQILDKLRITLKTIYFEIFFDKLSKLSSEEHEYRPISRFPAAIRDIAVLVPQFVRVEEVLNKIETVAGSLIRDIDLFDIYEGEELPQGKKNLAFHLIYQAEDRTLSSKEIDQIQDKIIKAIEEESEWQVRK